MVASLTIAVFGSRRIWSRAIHAFLAIDNRSFSRSKELPLSALGRGSPVRLPKGLRPQPDTPPCFPPELRASRSRDLMEEAWKEGSRHRYRKSGSCVHLPKNRIGRHLLHAPSIRRGR